jgi:hypothetical protein
VRARACFEEGGSLQDLQFKIFSCIYEKYFRGTGAEFFRTSSKYLPLCRLSLQNNHEIWSFRHRTTSYSLCWENNIVSNTNTQQLIFTRKQSPLQILQQLYLSLLLFMFSPGCMRVEKLYETLVWSSLSY